MLALADKYIVSLRFDWEKTKRFAFNERSNPDDNKLGLQIVKVKGFMRNHIISTRRPFSRRTTAHVPTIGKWW